MLELRLYKELLHLGHPVRGRDQVVLRGLLLQQFRDKGQFRWREQLSAGSGGHRQGRGEDILHEGLLESNSTSGQVSSTKHIFHQGNENWKLLK